MHKQNYSELLQTVREVKPNTFIFEKNGALNGDLCDSIVRRFEDASDEHRPGYVGQNRMENPDLKRSTDFFIGNKDKWKDADEALFRSLMDALRELCLAFPYFRGKFKDVGYNLQRTQKGEFYHWHIDSDSRELSDRQLVAIWYLNEVDGPGGETEFLFQDVRVKPERGKLLLFPPFWTHPHRGTTLKSGVKYIATTWVTFK